ncbi:MAG: hypothetical protein ACJ8DI_19855 [Ktedonobacteraceae bacterium]
MTAKRSNPVLKLPLFLCIIYMSLFEIRKNHFFAGGYIGGGMLIFFLHMLKRRFMTPFFVLLILSGCGQPLSSQHPQKTSNPALPSVGASVVFDLGGWIGVKSAGGFTCNFEEESRTLLGLDDIFPGALVLPTVRSTYDQGTLQSVKNYVAAVDESADGANSSNTPTGYSNLSLYPAFSAAPDAFQLVAATDRKCGEVLEITNIGNEAVKISQVHVEFTADTRVDNQSYNLIDACPLLPSARPCPPSFRGGTGGLGVYTASFQLNSEKKNTINSATYWGDDFGKFQIPTLQPGEIIQVTIEYDRPKNLNSNLSFSIRPSFTLTWPDKQPITYPAPQLQAMFSFTHQFSCYGLQDQQFTKISSGSQQTWCV